LRSGGFCYERFWSRRLQGYAGSLWLWHGCRRFEGLEVEPFDNSFSHEHITAAQGGEFAGAGHSLDVIYASLDDNRKLAGAGLWFAWLRVNNIVSFGAKICRQRFCAFRVLRDDSCDGHCLGSPVRSRRNGRIELDATFPAKVAPGSVCHPEYSVRFAEIHAVGKLQAGNLPRVVLDFKVGFEQFDIDLFPLYGTAALSTDAVEREITVVRFHKFPDHVVHGEADSQSRARCLKSCKYLNPMKN